MCSVNLTYYGCESCAWRDIKSPLRSQHMPDGLKKINPQREVERPCEKRRNVKGHADKTLSTEWVYVAYPDCERCAERNGRRR